MPRKSFSSKREIMPDPKYGDLIVQQFINKIMKAGKKSTAEGIVYSAMERLAEGKEEGPVGAFKKALESARPLVMVKSTRIGGATYQVPTEISLEKSIAIAMRWIITVSRARSEKTMMAKLHAELDDAYHKRGTAFKKREDTHKMAEANKAFAHYKR